MDSTRGSAPRRPASTRRTARPAWSACVLVDARRRCAPVVDHARAHEQEARARSRGRPRAAGTCPTTSLSKVVGRVVDRVLDGDRGRQVRDRVDARPAIDGRRLRRARRRPRTGAGRDARRTRPGSRGRRRPGCRRAGPRRRAPAAPPTTQRPMKPAAPVTRTFTDGAPRPPSRAAAPGSSLDAHDLWPRPIDRHRPAPGSRRRRPRRSAWPVLIAGSTAYISPMSTARVDSSSVISSS